MLYNFPFKKTVIFNLRKLQILLNFRKSLISTSNKKYSFQLEKTIARHLKKVDISTCKKYNSQIVLKCDAR